MIWKTHGLFPFPAHGPLAQLPNSTLFPEGTAVSVILVFDANEFPAGLCWTEPVPLPVVDVVSENVLTVLTPLPLSVAWTSPSLLATSNRAARLPSAWGVNVTVIEHCPPGGIGAVHAFVCEKSPGLEPFKAMPVNVSGAVAL